MLPSENASVLLPSNSLSPASRPRVSIAMATFNGERFVREQLESILAQSVSDFELVISDDASTDGTCEILQEYSEKDARIRIYRNDSNLGLKKNFERAIRLCQADFIALSDQDDIWYPDHLQVLLSHIGHHVLCAGDANIVDANNTATGERLSHADGFHVMPPPEKLLWRVMFVMNILQGASMLLRKDFVERILPIPVWVSMHDKYFTACACCVGGPVFVPRPITRYRQHSDNVTASCHNKQGRKIIPLAKYIDFLTGKFRPVTDRVALCRKLLSLFGSNKEVETILQINLNLASRRITPELVRTLWDNYEFIVTKHGHRDFLKYLLIWLFTEQKGAS